MLEFVHLSGAEAGKDLQTRRKVRSQAMRDFRRRQRAEREATSKAGGGSSTKAPAKARGPSSSQRDRSSSSGTFQTSDRRSIPPPEPSPPAMVLDFATPDFELATSSVQMPAIALYGDYSGEEASHDIYQGAQMFPHSQTDIPYWNPATEQNQQTFVPRSPSAWITEPDDHFQSPAHLNQMLNFCKSYVHWLRPGTDPDYAGKILADAWDSSHCAALSAACCLASVGHLDAVQPNRPGGNYAMYKARVLRGVTESMKSPDLATSDATIGCLAMLTSYEMSRCSGEAATHLKGLKSILSMKSDTGTNAYAGLAEIEILDLLHAVIFRSPLILTTPEAFISTTGEPRTDSDAPDGEVFARLLPLLLAEQAAFRTMASSLDDTKLEGLSALLSSAADSIRTVLVDGSCSDSCSRVQAILESFRSNLEHFNMINCGVSDPSPDGSDASHLARACYLTMTIFYHTVCERYDMQILRQTHVNGLFTAVRQIKDSTWADLPYLRLLILLRGAVAAKDSSKKSFFKAQLVRTIYQMDQSERKRVKNFIINYLNLTNTLERSPLTGSPPSSESSRTSSVRYTHLTPQWPRRSGSSTDGSPLGRAATVDNGSLYHHPPYFSSRTTTPNSFSVQATPYQDVDIDPFLRYTHSENFNT